MEQETNQQDSGLQEKSLQENNLQPWGMKLKTFCMMMHLSQLSSIVVPGLGLVLPIVMWATNKDASPLIDAHGKNILNWLISSLIYAGISLILTLVFVGVIGLFAIGIMSLVFAIMGAVKANDGVVWKYPCTITFLK